MMIKSVPFQLKNVFMNKQIQYEIVRSKYIQKQKQKFFGEQEKTLLLRTKFLLKETKYTLFEGCRQLKKDLKWIIDIQKNKPRCEMTGYQLARRRHVVTDLLKFVPYSLIIIIPAAEVFLPVILWLFPNAIPSFFLFDTKHAEKIDKLQKIQEESHSFLLQKFLSTLRAEKMRDDVFLEYDEFKKQFFQIKDRLDQKLNYNDFSSDDLIRVMEFLGSDYYTVSTTLNKFVNLFTGDIPRTLYKIFRYFYYKIKKQKPPKYEDPFFVKENFKFLKLNYFPFQPIKRQFLLWQINKKYENLRQEDEAFFKYGMNDIQGAKIKDFARQRGLSALSCYITLKNVLINDWVQVMSDQKIKSNNEKLWYSVMLFNFISKNNHEQN